MAGNSRNVNVEVSISGEQKYKQAISELNSANKTLGAELNRLSEEYRGNEESMEFLTQKGEALQSMLDHQREKVQQLQEAVKLSAQLHGEASDKTQKLAQQLASAETSVIRLERAIGDNNKAMQQQAYSTTEFDEQLKLLTSDLKVVDSQIAAGQDTIEGLREKDEILNEILSEQGEKLQTLSKALEEMKASGTASEDEVRELTIQVNDATVAYNNTSAAIDKNSEALQKNLADLGREQQGLVSIGDALDGMTQKFGISLPSAAKDALNGMGSFSTGTVAALGAAAAGVTALYEGIKKLYELTVDYAAKADEILTKSAQTGLSTEFIQAYEYAEQLVDVDLETFIASMRKLTDQMDAARDGNEALAEAFQSLGVEITDTTDGSLRPADQVLLEVIDALSQMENETERNALASDLLGKSYQNLNPLIVSGTEDLKGYMEAAQENYVLSQEELEILGKLDDAVVSNRNEWEGLKQHLATQFAPAATEALENFTKLVSNAGKALYDSQIIEGIGEVFEFLSNMMSPLTDLLSVVDGTEERLRPVYTILHSIAGLIAWITDAAQAAIGVLETLTIFGAKDGIQRYSTAMGYGASSGNYSNLQKWQGMGDTSGNWYNSETGMWEGNYGHNAGGTDRWRGGLTWVGESGPELVNLPQGSQILSAQESRNAAAGDVFYITIDAKNVKEFNDIVELAKTAQMRRRMR